MYVITPKSTNSEIIIPIIVTKSLKLELVPFFTKSKLSAVVFKPTLEEVRHKIPEIDYCIATNWVLKTKNFFTISLNMSQARPHHGQIDLNKK